MEAKMEREILKITVDHRDYYSTIADDGWPTGPCSSPEVAISRVKAYERGDEVDEAAPQQVSRRQMTTMTGWAAEEGLYAEVMLAIVARSEGLHTKAWIRASRAFEQILDLMPQTVWDVGGTRIRSAIGEASLMRAMPTSPGATCGAISIIEGSAAWTEEQIAALGLAKPLEIIELSDALHTRGYKITRAERLGDGSISAQIDKL